MKLFTNAERSDRHLVLRRPGKGAHTVRSYVVDDHCTRTRSAGAVKTCDGQTDLDSLRPRHTRFHGVARQRAVVAAGGPERVFRVHGATAPDPCHYPLPGRGPRGPRCTARRRASNARCNVVGSCRQFVLTLGVDP